MNLVHEGALDPNEPDYRDEKREKEEVRRISETVADIVSEMRECAEASDPAIWGDTMIAGLVRNAKAQLIDYANRIEAALEREREASEDETLVKSCNTCKHFTRKRKWCRVHDYSPHDPSKLPLIWPNGPCPQWECKYNGRGGAK